MIEKLAIRYDPAEDRLLMTFQLLEDGRRDTRRLWLTRRVCAAWAADMKAMKALAVAEPQSAFAMQPEVKPQRSRPLDAPAPDPVSEAPGQSPDGVPDEGQLQVIARVVCARRRADGRWVLRFHTRARQICSLTLSDQALLDTDAALSRQIKAAQWAIPENAEPALKGVSKPGRSLH